jgi:hypothetical protein
VISEKRGREVPWLAGQSLQARIGATVFRFVDDLLDACEQRIQPRGYILDEVLAHEALFLQELLDIS